MSADLRRVFASIGSQLLAEFLKAQQIQHPTGVGDTREGALRSFLRDYLPGRYAVGKGEIARSDGQTSRQCDVVLYDGDACPRLLASDDYSIFPLESVYGVVEVKSTLSSEKLKEAYQNVAAAKALCKTETFVHSPSVGLRLGVACPNLVGAIFAYTGGRSLDAIAKQLAELDREMLRRGTFARRPDLVAILDSGLAGARNYRALPNKLEPPSDTGLAVLRRTGKYTLLRFYLGLLEQLNTVVLEPLKLRHYLSIPAAVGEHRVSRHEGFVKKDETGAEINILRLTEAAIERVFTACQAAGPNKLSDLMPVKGMGVRDHPVFVYNPRGLPYLDLERVDFSAQPPTRLPDDMLHADWCITIDGDHYYVDMRSFKDSDFEVCPDVELGEFFSEVIEER